MKCIVCDNNLSGRQKLYCSRVCKNKAINQKHNSSGNQRVRGMIKKATLVKLMGGKCSNCDYKRNLSVLNFHHIDPKEKEFALDIRAFSSKSMDELKKEASKCKILCSNCHGEFHNPRFFNWENVGPLGLEPRLKKL